MSLSLEKIRRLVGTPTLALTYGRSAGKNVVLLMAVSIADAISRIAGLTLEIYLCICYGFLKGR